MTVLRRLTYVFALCPTLLLFACGGKVTDFSEDGGTTEDSDTDGGTTDGSTDASPDVPGSDVIGPDGGPSGCGIGPCSPGTGCFDGCNECNCVAPNVWECTDRACTDAGPPPPPPCPGYVPYDGTYCEGEGSSCTYPNGCGGNIYATCSMNYWRTKREPCTEPAPCPASLPAPMTMCSGPAKCSYSNGCGGFHTAWCDGKYWNVERGPCATPTCPAYQPPEGTSCIGPNKCSYPNGCGGYNTVTCDAPMATWKLYKGDCAPPPPPPPVCPSTMPSPDAKCTVGSSCTWSNGCGGLAYGYCSGGFWSIKNEGCVSGCPGTKPTSGTACKMPSATSCRYLVSGSMSCTTQCFCADDYRWACVTPPCTGMGGGEVPPSY
jgi:hypothetical protein